MKNTNPVIEKIIKWGAIAFAGIVAVIGEISDQRKEAEFADLKQRVEALEQPTEEA